jgi:protein-S-isoprenylcysteine O-methyltransferase Ste14
MTDPAEDRGPRVVVLPPVLFALTLMAGIALQWTSPLPLWDARWPRWVLGAVLLVAGLAFARWAERAMHRAGTHVRADRPSTAIVLDGPFRYTRNPLYLSVAAGFTVIALLANSSWFLLLLVPMALVLHFGIVLREERYLEAKFGEPYRAFRRRVRRYF